MRTDEFTNRLSDYIDGGLEPADRAAVDVHLAGCAECRTALDELRAVIARAASLEDSRPAGDLWRGIATRIAPGTGRASRVTAFRRILPGRRFSFTLPQLAAAAIALMVLSGGLVWMAKSGDPRADFQPLSAEPPVKLANFADSYYNGAVADLQRTLEADRTKLDPETVRVLEENLAAIDRAIEQSRRALAADPANVYLNRHLADARQRKLALLRRALTAAGG